MAHLRTKTCPELVYILASALKRVAPQSNHNILKIARFADINPERKIALAAVGEALPQFVRSLQDASESNN